MNQKKNGTEDKTQKGYTLFDFIYMKFQKRQNSRDRKQINSFRGINEKMQERTFEGDRNVQYLSNSVS